MRRGRFVLQAVPDFARLWVLSGIKLRLPVRFVLSLVTEISNALCVIAPPQREAEGGNISGGQEASAARVPLWRHERSVRPREVLRDSG